MKREDIEDAAREESGIWVPGPVHLQDIYRRDDFEAGFHRGANWRIDSVWHDVDKELPEYNRHVVNEDWFDFTAKDEKDLKRIMNQYPFKRWAYVDDLKPNMEE